jgi:hypothetical protein
MDQFESLLFIVFTNLFYKPIIKAVLRREFKNICFGNVIFLKLFWDEEMRKFVWQSNF